MAAEPESAFTAGWVLTLLKARELGLDAQPASDDFRNGNDTLNGTRGGGLPRRRRGRRHHQRR